MKKGIHPEYHRIMVKCTSCGNEFETGSTATELRVDTCSNCHPFYTGRQRFAAAQGRIENKQRHLGNRMLFFGKRLCGSNKKPIHDKMQITTENNIF